MTRFSVRIGAPLLAAMLFASCGDVGIQDPFTGSDSAVEQIGQDPSSRAPESTDPPGGEPGGQAESPDQAFPPLQGVAQFSSLLPPEPENVRKIIGPEGGSLSLGEFEIVVPAGAVARSTLFSIRRPVDRRSRQYVIAELGPHNVEFEEPVVVRMPVAGTDAEGSPATVDRWSGSEWTSQTTTVIEDGDRIEATTRSFSFWSARFFRGELISGGS